MTTTAEMKPPMPRWLKSVMLSAFVFLVCWSVAVWYWRTTDSEPSTESLFLVLILFPSLLTLSGYIASRMLAKHKLVDSPSAPLAVARPDTALPSHLLQIIAASVHVPDAASADELAPGLAANRLSTDIDPDLIDVDGFPIMSARSDEAVDDMLQEEVTEWLANNGLAEIQFNDAQWRALTLGSAAMRDLARQAVTLLLPEQGTPPPIELAAILPIEWEAACRVAAARWFRFVLSQFGWPTAQVTLRDQGKVDGNLLTSMIDRLADGTPTGNGAIIVLACASNIGQEIVDKWAADDILFTSSHSQGQIPGEGAAGLILLNGSQRLSLDIASAVNIHLEEEVLVSSTGAHHKQLPKVLAGLSEHAFERSHTQADKVVMAIGDTGHQTRQVLELMDFAMNKLPHLDASTDVLRTGAACGTAGAVPFVAALALAQHLALKHAQPVVCVSNDSPDRRALALITPSHTVGPRASLPKETADA